MLWKIWFMYRNTALHRSVSDLLKWIIWKSCFLKLYVSCYFSVISLSEKWKSLSHVQLFETPWTEFSRPRILEWVAFPFSRGSSQPRDWTQVSRIAGGFFTAEPQGKQLYCEYKGNDWTSGKWPNIFWPKDIYSQKTVYLIARYLLPEILLPESLKWSRSVMSDSLRPHRLQPARLLCPWDFPGNSTGVDCHFLLQGIFPNQGLNPGLLPCRRLLYHLSQKV